MQIESEQLSQQRLQAWWDLIGEEPQYPTTTATVVRLLQAVEYAADNDVILRAVDQKWFMPPERENSRLAWTATSICGLAAALESRRMWRPFSQIHGHKLSMVERLGQILNARGEATFNDLAEIDWPGLLGMLHKAANDSGAVVIIAEAIRQKLKTEGINV